MDLKRLRTFVAVAELGTVSRAALGCALASLPFRGKSCDLEQEFGFRLFDRVGRGLILTAIGEQLLGDCRGVLAHIGALGERAEILRRGDTRGAEGRRAAAHDRKRLVAVPASLCRTLSYVHVKLTEALGRDQSAMLEERRGPCRHQT